MGVSSAVKLRGTMDNRLELRNRVRKLRLRLRLRQSDLAKEAEVTRQTILSIEKGRLNPSIKLSLKIARVLREPVSYVFYLERKHNVAAADGPRMLHGALPERDGPEFDSDDPLAELA